MNERDGNPLPGSRNAHPAPYFAAHTNQGVPCTIHPKPDELFESNVMEKLIIRKDDASRAVNLPAGENQTRCPGNRDEPRRGLGTWGA